LREIGQAESDCHPRRHASGALAGGGPISPADAASILGAAHYLLRRPKVGDSGGLPAVTPADLCALLKDRETADEAVKYLAIMALVDGVLDPARSPGCLEYSRALDVEADYLTELVEAASGHMSWVIADMTRKNFDSVISRSSEGPRCGGVDHAPIAADKADADLVARYEALGRLPANTFGRALWNFDKSNGYSFPGDPARSTPPLPRRMTRRT